MNESEKALVEAVKAHALANYEKKFGWSEVIECYSDEQILEIVEGCTTPEQAIEAVADLVDVREERYREAVGPDKACENCGTVFPAELPCPKCDAALNATTWDY